MLEWAHTLALGVRGWTFKGEDNSGILEKHILWFFLSTITSTGVVLLTQAEQPIVLATAVMLLFHLRGWQDSHRERKMCPKSVKACLPFVWCSVSKGMDFCHKSSQRAFLFVCLFDFSLKPEVTFWSRRSFIREINESTTQLSPKRELFENHLHTDQMLKL